MTLRKRLVGLEIFLCYCLSEIVGDRQVQNHDSVIDGWDAFSDEEAVEAAIDKFGKDPDFVSCLLCIDGGRRSETTRVSVLV